MSEEEKQHANNRYSALVIGGTGAVGAYLVQQLIASPDYKKVTVISRSPLPTAKKLNNVIWADFPPHLFEDKPQSIKTFTQHDVLFCCLGAPEKALIGLLFNKTKFAQQFQTVDYDYVVAAASLAHKAGIQHFSVISSPSADPNARFLYSKIKGEMEQAIQAINFSSISIFHPYHLMKPAVPSTSFFKKALKNTIAFIARIMPAKQQAIKVEEVTTAMRLEFELRLPDEQNKIMYYHSDDMRKLITSQKA